MELYILEIEFEIHFFDACLKLCEMHRKVDLQAYIIIYSLISFYLSVAGRMLIFADKSFSLFIFKTAVRKR